MTPVLVFDIETIPDAAGLRKLWGVAADVSDQAVIDLASQRRRQATGSDFLPAHVQRVVAISCVMRSDEGVRAWSLGTAQDAERDIVQRFFDGIEKYTPQLVSWNGGGFDLPVLQYRGLVHGVVASRYWDQGEEDKDFRFNNYIARYHARHTDLMDVLSLYQNRGQASLDDMARLLGFPGKIGLDGSKVWDAYQAGEIESIRNYCAADAANTYLVFQRFQLVRGLADPARYEKELRLVRDTLARSGEPHWREFLARWA